MKRTKLVPKNKVLAGNIYDKHNSKNPIARYLINNFEKCLKNLVSLTKAQKIYEIGCGEGNISILLAKSGKEVRASDISAEIIAKAKKNAKENNVKISFETISIYDIKPEKNSNELIICCEVLEHLKNPQKAIKILSKLANPYLIVSAPREPLWRILNLLRGQYIFQLGNTPSHINHWSKLNFINLLSSQLEIIKVLTPLPWTMVLCRKKTLS